MLGFNYMGYSLALLKSRQSVLSAKSHHKWCHLKLYERPEGHSSVMAGSWGLDPDFGSRIRQFEIRISRIQWQAYLLPIFTSRKAAGHVLVWVHVHVVHVHVDNGTFAFLALLTPVWSFRSFTLLKLSIFKKDPKNWRKFLKNQTLNFKKI